MNHALIASFTLDLGVKGVTILAWFSLLQYYVSNIVLTERCRMTEAAQNCISLFHGFVSAVLPTSWNVTCRYGVPPRTETYGFNQLQLVWQWLWAVSSKQPSKATGHPKRTEMIRWNFLPESIGHRGVIFLTCYCCPLVEAEQPGCWAWPPKGKTKIAVLEPGGP